MALNFPNSPTVGQKYPVSPIAGIPTYAWDGEKWTTNGGATTVGSPPYNSIPPMDGAGASGSIINYARGDHQHPSDTSRAPLASPTFTGTVTAPGWHVTGNATIDGSLTVASITAVGAATVGGTLTAGAVKATVSVNACNSPISWPLVVNLAPNINAGLYYDGTNLCAGFGVINDVGSAWGSLFIPSQTAFAVPPTAPTPGAGDNSTKLATTAFVLANVPTGSYLPLAGGTISGNLTVNGHTYLNASEVSTGGFMTFFQPLGYIGQGGQTNVMIQATAGGQPAMSFHVPGAFACNFGMDSTGAFYKGGWSFGSSVYKFWTQQDFNGVPVTTGRLAYAGDFNITGGGLSEPYGGAVVTAYDYIAGVMRFRYMQLFTTGWFTIGYA
jgi:hypothetical protein